ncbi:MAG: hypothetical protein HW380_427 [Magnetococcales bacterium]|nr:hypothetical protein [Magnetococcales bacterium]
MPLEILVEDQSGKQALKLLLPKIVGSECTFKVIAYKGVGHIPKNLHRDSDPTTRIFLEQLPRGYGEAFSKFPEFYWRTPGTSVAQGDGD